MHVISLRAIQEIDALPAVFFRPDKSGVFLNRIPRHLVKLFFEFIKQTGRYRAGVLVLPFADQNERIPTAQAIEIQERVCVKNKAVIKRNTFEADETRGSLHDVNMEIDKLAIENLDHATGIEIN